MHAVVALPADAPDTFADDANRLAGDVASLSAWWLTQDPSRSPRFDLATYPGGTCLDISFVRLPAPAATYSVATDDGAGKAFTAVQTAMIANDQLDPYKKYLVYVDGFGSTTDPVCGTGEGVFDTGPAYAAVWLRACGVPTDAVAAHELLHALGALPSLAPHQCPGDPGHPCDSPTDILYPYANGGPISGYVLDYGHDDYYAHAPGWPDIQQSIWMHQVGLPQFPLAVTVTGGNGTVSSDLPGVDCTASCTTAWDDGLTAGLSAVPQPGYRFVGWTGACTGTGVCSVAITSPTAVTARFGPARVPLEVAIRGKGRVTCSPGRCRPTAAAGEPLTLRARPAKGWRFLRWTGACRGTRVVCRPSTGAAVSVRATFQKLPAKKPKARAKR